MPCFVCEKCGCIDNTATGHYWGKDTIMFKEGSLTPELIGKPLCIECMPLFYCDGSSTGAGEWHDLFTKEHWTVHYTIKPEGYF